MKFSLLNLSTFLFLVLVSFSTIATTSPKKAYPGREGTVQADQLDACIAPTDFMRRNHFELIKHQRDITVHQGIRLTNKSLAGCIDCHARKDAHDNFVPVNAPGEFCASCHTYTGTSIDCFTCHLATPPPKGP